MISETQENHETKWATPEVQESYWRLSAACDQTQATWLAAKGPIDEFLTTHDPDRAESPEERCSRHTSYDVFIESPTWTQYEAAASRMLEVISEWRGFCRQHLGLTYWLNRRSPVKGYLVGGPEDGREVDVLSGVVKVSVPHLLDLKIERLSDPIRPGFDRLPLALSEYVLREWSSRGAIYDFVAEVANE